MCFPAWGRGAVLGGCGLVAEWEFSIFMKLLIIFYYPLIRVPILILADQLNQNL